MAIDLQPTLQGNTLRLRPLRKDDLTALHAAAADPETWAQHPDRNRYRRGVFEERFFKSAIASRGALVIEEISGGTIVGSSRYYDWAPDLAECAIGYTFITPRLWGTGANTELKRLMLNHIFQWAASVWFHVGDSNQRSRKAVEKLGAVLRYKEARELDGIAFNQLYYQLDRDTFLRWCAASG